MRVDIRYALQLDQDVDPALRDLSRDAGTERSRVGRSDDESTSQVAHRDAVNGSAGHFHLVLREAFSYGITTTGENPDRCAPMARNALYLGGLRMVLKRLCTGLSDARGWREAARCCRR